jgi:POT family proton-dependent oligopeptide transporter
MPPERHPRGLSTLFFTEMWERLSYYGMRALLILFMVDQVQDGGLGLDDKTAAAIYGLYTAGVYLAALPGGWIADRLIGAQRAVLVGGTLIALGHFTLAVPRTDTFFLGLIFIVLGTGLLKPNISSLVGVLYPEGGARRDAGFTIFYMGINLGALLGPLLCSWLGENVNWHAGFAAAGIGMVVGLIQFSLTRQSLQGAGAPPVQLPAARRDTLLLLFGIASLVIMVTLVMAGIIILNPIALAERSALVIAAIAVLYFIGIFVREKLDGTERRRIAVIGILFIASALFWAGYEQAGSSLNLFAERFTSRTIEAFRLTLPAGWFQSVPAIFVILFAPLVAGLWLRLARRGREPSLPAKFGWGLLFLALGFFVVTAGSQRALQSGTVWPTWLIMTYLLHVWGELFVSPVGLSSVTKLSPPRLVGQMMGIWFLATSLGNLLAGLFAGQVSGANTQDMPAGFFNVAVFASAVGLLLLLLAKPIRRLMAGVQ